MCSDFNLYLFKSTVTIQIDVINVMNILGSPFSDCKIKFFWIS